MKNDEWLAVILVTVFISLALAYKKQPDREIRIKLVPSTVPAYNRIGPIFPTDKE